jgi:hypothetical protein
MAASACGRCGGQRGECTCDRLADLCGADGSAARDNKLVANAEGRSASLWLAHVLRAERVRRCCRCEVTASAEGRAASGRAGTEQDGRAWRVSCRRSGAERDAELKVRDETVSFSTTPEPSFPSVLDSVPICFLFLRKKRFF